MTQPGYLSLVQWLSPAFPTGAYAYSHGLEAAVVAGDVTGAADLRRWLTEVLRFGSGRQDAILLTAALAPDADHAALDDLARALAPGAERLTETLDQGTAFAATVAALTGRALPPRCLPVALGEAAGPLNLPPADVLGLYLHGFVSNLVSVAVRFVPLGQAAGQAVLASLHPLIAELATEAAGLTPDDLGSGAWGADLAAMHHETLDVRIFRT